MIELFAVIVVICVLTVAWVLSGFLMLVFMLNFDKTFKDVILFDGDIPTILVFIALWPLLLVILLADYDASEGIRKFVDKVTFEDKR